jgi:UDP:flavonoid glycosyltransferase YjiC (YdhE family)
MYALFVALPYVGHLNPLLRQAHVLQQRGWRVAVGTAREMAAHVAAEAPGVPFVDLGPLGSIGVRLRHAEAAASAEPDYRRGALYFLAPLGEIWPILFDGAIAAIARDRPDVMVVDLFTSAALSAADAARVPYVVNDPSLLNAVPLELLPPAARVPFVTSGRSIHDTRWWQALAEPVLRHGLQAAVAFTLGRQLNVMRDSRGLRRTTLHALMRDRPILVNGAFGLEYERPLPPYVHMVGPMLDAVVPSLPGELDAWLSHGPPVVYANLGTVARAPAEQIAKMVAAFDDPAFRVLWVVKDALQSRLPAQPPPHIRIESRVPSPRAVLAHHNVRAFVSHCGINSVHESLDAGTPVVGIPMLSDQRDMAVRIADAGVGVWMDKSRFTAAGLDSAIRRVLLDEGFRARMPALQAAFAQAGGVHRAADVIEAQARTA